ncbi:hypothetical protein WR25_13342 [Diploscapter pachys]|uniref:E3 ubiquitin-protein ligase ZNRF1 n=1 Tax=Diploscapter pachys TaxID=2018661 RepID=A0A2A2JHD8_9BILA|nr:hypothetical protein WR25_13342 [Diploscapter pachys]
MGGRQSTVAEQHNQTQAQQGGNQASSSRPRASSLRHDRSNDNHQFSDADELIRALRTARLLSSSSDSYEPPGDDDTATSSTGNSATRGRNSAAARRRPHNSRRSVPLFMMDLKCPVCSKIVPSDEADVHLIMCLTRPRITYNDDVLIEDKGECAICLEDMSRGDQIARLPCLCVYHKHCIDDWFLRKNTCPEHPGD